MPKTVTGIVSGWRTGRGPIGPIDLVAFTMIVVGFVLRVNHFSFPASPLFDENHFIQNARNYLAGRPDWNDHPPLGKLIIAASISRMGDRSVAWRFPALVCGVMTILLGAVAARRLFRSQAAGWFTAALLSADGFFISYSRVALLDGYLATCAAGALLLASARWRLWMAIWAGCLVGLAGSIKFSGIGVVFPLVIALSTERRTGVSGAGRQRLLFLGVIIGVAAVVYWGVFAIGLRLTGQPASVSRVAGETLRLLGHHIALTEMKNPWTSSWPTWVLPVRPVLLGFVDLGYGVRVLSSLGNLIIWWASIVVGVIVMVTIAWRGLAATLYGGPASPVAFWPATFVAEHGRAAIIVLSTATGFLAPWVVTHRDSYIYHFLPCYLSLVLMLGAVLAWWIPRRPTAVLIFVVITLVVTCFYAPVWSFVPISQTAFKLRLFLPSWR